MGRDGRSDRRPDLPSSPREHVEPSRRAHPGFGEGLSLPKAETREAVRHAGRDYRLRGSEARTLATVGAFRIVPVSDLRRDPRDGEATPSDLRALREARLVEERTAIIGGRSERVVGLTKVGRGLLEAHRSSNGGRMQQYHAGFVKARETAHDAQLYRMFCAEANRIDAEHGRVSRVVLDYELKREYQAFLNRADRPTDESLEDAREAFADAHRLSVVDDHLELPDLRLEYETEDGRLEYRDLELVTEHYSRSQLAGKARAGFTAYRGGGRPAGEAARTGGTPYDPHYLGWLA